MTKVSEWAIPRPVWAVLVSWGMAVLLLAGVLSYWIWHNEQEQERDEAALQLELDRAACATIQVFLDPPPPPPGPEGERARAIQAAMQRWSDVLHCREIQSDSPGPSRDRDHK